MSVWLSRVSLAVSFSLACAFVVVAFSGRIWMPGEEQALLDRLDALITRVDALEEDKPERPEPPKARVETGVRYPVRAIGPSQGPEDAPVVIVKFVDLECPFCKRGEAVLDQLRERYPEDVRVVYRHNPLPFHKQAMQRARQLECAEEQGRFHAMEDWTWELGRGEKLDAGGLRGIDRGAFEACMASERPARDIERDMAAAKELGARGTPTYFVNGRAIVGSQPLAKFVEFIDIELAGPRPVAGLPKGDEP